MSASLAGESINLRFKTQEERHLSEAFHYLVDGNHRLSYRFRHLG